MARRHIATDCQTPPRFVSFVTVNLPTCTSRPVGAMMGHRWLGYRAADAPHATPFALTLTMQDMPAQRSSPVHTVDMQREELDLYLEVIPRTVRKSWHLSRAQADALLGDLHEGMTMPLTAAQHGRLTALLTIHHALTPRPLMHGRGFGAVLHHPRTAPDGTRAAISALCEDQSALDRVAAFIHNLPHGPLLLPGVLTDLVASGTYRPELVADLFAEARVLCDDPLPTWRDPADRAEARSLVALLEAAVRDAPCAVRRQVLTAMACEAEPGTAAWALQELATEVV